MKLKRASKSERLIYIVMFLWIVFGIVSIIYDSNLSQVAGYYVSLTLFISTYLWGEHKRTSTSTFVLSKGPTSSREIVIYVTVLLWSILGLFGIIRGMNINNLTVYFSSLSPFVTSYIIYKTTKGADLPIFNDETKAFIDKAKEGADKIDVLPKIIDKLEKMDITNKNKEDEIIKPTNNIEIKDEDV